MPNLLTDSTSAVLTKALDGLSVRQQVIANNIANVETPGFTRSTVTFEDQLKQAMGSDDQSATLNQVRGVRPQIQTDQVSPARPDGNNVSIDQEMVDMNKTSLQYETVAQLMNMKIAMLKSAISEGKR